MSTRNPLLVLLWSSGLLVMIHLVQYPSALIGAMFSGTGFESVISGEYEDHLVILGRGLTAMVVGIPWALLVVRLLWRRGIEWMRLALNLRLLGGGILLGLILPLVISAIIAPFASISITCSADRYPPGALIAAVIGGIGWAMYIATAEELVFRGMAVREWAYKWGWPAATLLGGVYFGAAHLLGIFGKLSIGSALWILAAAIIGNLLFVALYIRGRSLWLPIGFHAGWNLCLSNILGTALSGNAAPISLFNLEMSGPSIFTGGIFGMEASVVTMVVYAGLTVFLLWRPRRGKPTLLNTQPGRNIA